MPSRFPALPRVLSAVIAALLLPPILVGAGCSRSARRPNIVLIVLDTVRSDFTGVDGSRGASAPGIQSCTPTLDALGAGATRFVNAWSDAPWTVPSHASMFTGALPSQHHTTMDHLRFDTPLPSLAELLSRAGYRTAAFYANPWLAPNVTGLVRGFETERESPGSGLMNRPLQGDGYQGGRSVLADATAWLRQTPRDKPFFLFLNFMEAHLPYDPPAEVRRETLADLPPGDQVSMRWAIEFNAGLHPADQVDWRRVRRLYGGDVRTDDLLLGAFLHAFHQTGLDANTVLIVASDHGENLGEHGLIAHQFSVHETLLSVPLVVRAPGRLAPGIRSDPVMLSDLFATALDCAGVKDAPVPASSRSLLAPPLPASRPLVAEAARPHASLLATLLQANPKFDTRVYQVAYRTVRIGDLRLTLGDNGTVQLNDLAADPGQERNLAAGRPDDVRALQVILDAQTSGRGPGAPPEDLKLDEQTRQKLRALGYVH